MVRIYIADHLAHGKYRYQALMREVMNPPAPQNLGIS